MIWNDLWEDSSVGMRTGNWYSEDHEGYKDSDLLLMYSFHFSFMINYILTFNIYIYIFLQCICILVRCVT